MHGENQLNLLLSPFPPLLLYTFPFFFFLYQISWYQQALAGCPEFSVSQYMGESIDLEPFKIVLNSEETKPWYSVHTYISIIYYSHCSAYIYSKYIVDVLQHAIHVQIHHVYIRTCKGLVQISFILWFRFEGKKRVSTYNIMCIWSTDTYMYSVG